MDIKFVEKNWHFLSLVHSVGRAFSSGSQLKCYLDGVLLSSEKCRYANILKLIEGVMFVFISRKLLLANKISS